MPVIVCFGDSNTWGSDPATRARFGPDVRWTGVLRPELGHEYSVIEEGLSGRTTNLDDLIEEHRNGRAFLPACLESHRPFELITIMLGTNDLKARFSRNASDIAQSAGLLGVLAHKSGCGIDGAPPKVLIIAPPPLSDPVVFGEMFTGGIEKSRQFGELYRFFAERNGLHFMDAGATIGSSPVDGIHFEASDHAKLGKEVARRIKGILG